MSADNFGICPRCSSRKKRAVKDGEHRLEELYGKVPQEEWAALDRNIRALEGEANTRDLDERWEVGVEGEQDPPVFCVSYGCRCEVCGFEFSFQHREIVNVEEVSVNREWSMEWPQESGHYWFYGWLWSDSVEPEMYFAWLSRCQNPFLLIEKDSRMYVIGESHARGLWKCALVPEKPGADLLAELEEVE